MNTARAVVRARHRAPLDRPTRALWRHREFRALWLAIGQSQFGDQLGRVALSVLVFTRTGSGGLTALVYALTYLPAVVGGVLLSGWADRFPRRTLLVWCDLGRAGCFAAMAVPSVPLVAVAALLVVAVLIGAPHKAAEPAVVADLFLGGPHGAAGGSGTAPDARYTAALGVRTATAELAQLAGFAVGGVLVGGIGPRPALALDAATFVVSAALLGGYLQSRQPLATAADRRGYRAVRSGIAVVAGDSRLRLLLAFSWLAACWLVPEGLAAPYAAAHHAGAKAVGLLLAADPVGVLVGSLLLAQTIRPTARARVIGPLAVASGIPLIAFAFDPALPLAWLLLAACGALSSYQVLVVAEFLGIVAPDQRGQAIGIASAGLLAAQGLGILAGGAVSERLGTAPAIALAGVTGAVLAVAVTGGWKRAGASSRQTTPTARVRRSRRFSRDRKSDLHERVIRQRAARASARRPQPPEHLTPG